VQQGTPCSACVAPLSTTSLLTVEGGTALPSLQQLAAGRPRLKCDGTRAETKFRLSAKRTSPFKPTGASVHSTTGSRGVRTSGSNAGYTKFRGSVKDTGYPTLFASFPFTSPPVRHRVPSRFGWALPTVSQATRIKSTTRNTYFLKNHRRIILQSTPNSMRQRPS